MHVNCKINAQQSCENAHVHGARAPTVYASLSAEAFTFTCSTKYINCFNQDNQT